MEAVEVWKPVMDYELFYEVSNFGNIKSFYFKEPKLLIQENIKNYFRISLYKNNKIKRMYVHRLVAIHFIPNSKNKPEVNHKDENPSNNHVDNLEWVTSRENMEYSLTKKSITKVKGVHWIERQKSYQCSIWFNRKKHFLGTTKDLEEAKVIVSNFLNINNIK